MTTNHLVDDDSDVHGPACEECGKPVDVADSTICDACMDEE